MTRWSMKMRAFTLTEMIGALVLLTAFGLIATRLFTQTMHVLSQAPASADGIARFESLSQSLRQDAWGARAFSAAGGNAIQIESSNEASIRWEIDGAGDVYRTQGAQRQRWIEQGIGAVLVIDGPSIVLRSTRPAADGTPEVRFVSLVQLAAIHGDGK